ncbi:hypothetical protein SAMN04489712_105153 [Thermomonospora echinospora]|uniref:Cysteinyl-tRNA synthetase n=1 Tax=Thermomonospora echinospora TaxID=1992 RepID=A0A1H6A2U7_9ACTN|nr:hypothetical protein [Thermomonospora echinospora]SEG42682.1 hypothetical protein SAMN04489712_105153 [Thermomonospora echinospora]
MDGTLRLYDPGNGRLEELPPGPLHIHVRGPGLRAFVIADLLRRVAGRRRRRVRVTCSGPFPEVRALADFNVLEMEAGETASAQVVVAEGDESNAIQPNTARLLLVPAFEPPPADEDPMTLRLAILHTAYRDPLPWSERLADARARLDRWRALMAEWAESPGRPMDRTYAADAERALTDDLDSPAALAVLEGLAADPAVAPGAKFETFVHLDLVLALDLVRDIGHR